MLKYLCCQPATQYYAWQVEVMLHNFTENGVNPADIHIVCSATDRIDRSWQKLRSHYRDVNFFFYPDTRIDKTYISSVRPHILEKHWRRFPELTDHPIFYHDCDVLLTNEWDLSNLLEDSVWYLSDTNSYIGSDYIKEKEFNIFEEMCQIIDISPREVERRERLSGGAGGAQYLLKGVTHLFWRKVEIDSTNLYKYFLEKSHEWPEENYHPIQAWTADMWAVLWNAWLFGHRTIVHEDLNFVWPTNSSLALDRVNLFHNAGVLKTHTDYFRKSDYINVLPYGQNIEINKDKATHFYWEWVQKTAQNSCLV